MKKDRFHITNIIKELIINIDNNLTNFPKKEIELKRQIKETAYEMLEIAYEGNSTYNLQKRRNLQEKLIAKIKYEDFLINLCYDKQIINGKKYLKFGEHLNYLLKYVNGWLKETNEKWALSE